LGEDKFDAIVVGAGPAGCACAYSLARAGRNVLIIERGDAPGAKNVTGGRLYTYALDALDPALRQDAALERKVTHEQVMIMGGERSINVDFHDPSFNKEGGPPMSYTVLRAKFDQWLGEKVEEAGGTLACGIRVDDIIEKEGKIAGIRAGEDEIYADVVVAADGINSFMAQKAGLIKDIDPRTIGVGVKEVIELPAGAIERRFNLKEDEGAARVILGCTRGTRGGGFLYTNKESISLGCVFMPEGAQSRKVSVHEMFQDLKMHPSIYPLIEDGDTVEYGAHLVTEAGYRGIPGKLFREGILVAGDAAGFMINTGYSLRGIDLAMMSGIAAAKAILGAGNAAAVGPAYMKELENVKLLPAMKALDGFSDVMETGWLYDRAPHLATDLFNRLFTVTGEVPGSIRKDVTALVRAHGLSIWDFMKFGFKGVRSL
jgi:electron transfer flavoprotein-quinone oxidoreductase